MLIVKFDKETVIVVVICLAVLIGWALYYPKWQAEKIAAAKQEQLAAQQAETAAAKISAVSPAVTPPVQTVAGTGKTAPAPAVKTVPRAYSITTKNTDYFFNSAGILHEIVLKNHKMTGEDKPIIVRETDGFEPLSIAIPGLGVKSIRIDRKNGQELTVTKVFAGTVDLFLVKTFSVTDRSNILNCRVQLSAKTGVSIPRLIVWGGTLAPLKQLANDNLRDIYMIEYCLASTGKVVKVDPAAKAEKFQRGITSEPLEWIAVSNKYFLTFLSGTPIFDGGCELINPTIRETGSKDSYKQAGIAGVYDSITLQPGKPFEASYQFYLGPKILAEMKGLPASSGNAIHLAYWGWLEPLCRPMLQLLNLLKDLTGSYGLAIILLTVIVKLVLWPLIHKGNKSMRRMQRIQPQLKELKEKYKDNQQEFSRRMMELYRKENVSPFGGCLPMLLQLPVFIALYSTLDSSVELRHVAFLWAQDLSRPDLVGPTIFGIGLHPFIIISTLLMVLQQKIMPPMAGDPMQQKVMMYMPVIMLFFFYNFPSGLALYWTVNNVLSILQMKFSQYAAQKEEQELKNSAGKVKA